MDFQKLAIDFAANFIASAANSTILSDTFSRFNTTATEATVLATGATAAIGILMTRNSAMVIVKYAIAIVIAICAYFVSEVVLTKILHFVKVFLCILAALLIFLSAKTLMQDFFVT